MGIIGTTPRLNPLLTSERPSVAVNGKPVVVPALQRWNGGQGRMRLLPSSRIVISTESAAQLKPIANRLAADLRDMYNISLSVAVGRLAESGDIVLSLSPTADVGSDTEVARHEGYTLAVKDFTTIEGRRPQAVFWGTRSLLQMAEPGSSNSATLPRGLAVDWPNYRTRGFILDVGRRWFPPSFIRDYIRYMSWFKLNTFQIHLNDNEIKAPGGDWSKAYSAFRLASDNPAFADLAAKDGAFTRASWNTVEDTAADYFVQIIPEIDAPAHSRAFIKFQPELGLNHGNSSDLDLSNPTTTVFMKSVFDEFVPWFRGDIVHFGADEYPRQHADDYQRYFNAMASHLRALGKQPMAWGSLSVISGGNTGYDHQVLIEAWNDEYYSPQSAIRDGYRTVNTNDDLLYIVPFANYYHGHNLDGQWLFETWEPNVSSSSKVYPRHRLLDGAMSAVWNDLVHKQYYGDDVHRLVEPTFGLLAQKMWRGVEPGQSYDDLMRALVRFGVGPGMESLKSTLSGSLVSRDDDQEPWESSSRRYRRSLEARYKTLLQNNSENAIE